MICHRLRRLVYARLSPLWILFIIIVHLITKVICVTVLVFIAQIVFFIEIFIPEYFFIGELSTSAALFQHANVGEVDLNSTSLLPVNDKLDLRLATYFEFFSNPMVKKHVYLGR